MVSQLFLQLFFIHRSDASHTKYRASLRLPVVRLDRGSLRLHLAGSFLRLLARPRKPGYRPLVAGRLPQRDPVPQHEHCPEESLGQKGQRESGSGNSETFGFKR